MVGQAGARLIKRYENRKLYDVSGRRYVTLPALGAMVGRGQEVQVVDQRTGADLTTVVLAQALLESVKEHGARVPGQLLAGLIRLGRGPAALRQSWPSAQEAAARARQEAERIVRRLGRLSLEDALAVRQELAASLQRVMADVQQGIEAHLTAWLRRLEGDTSPPADPRPSPQRRSPPPRRPSHSRRSPSNRARASPRRTR